MQKTEATPSRPAAVYRLWAEDGTLLYIGSAYNPEERAKAHRRTEWGPLVARRTDEWHCSREVAYEAEADAIAAEDPRHNVAGTPRHTGPAERGRVQREASDARWRVALAAIRAGASAEEARRAGGWAEVEYLEASGLMQGLAAKWRRQMEEQGGTYNSKNMSLPAAVNGRLTWEMRASEVHAARAGGQLGWTPTFPNIDRWERLQPTLAE
ncbi:GIY-YIG nuclease family protein [Streptomyces carpinensis]|uniref:GIY-YIG nuclease family protein n=1 Tax=Streptomyces carpinensis TaxID=66369 RepID=A0ABV1WDV0_9ACTN|nr:GIY-YIG nuclease family protein [Streptomyces carpinensis]